MSTESQSTTSDEALSIPVCLPRGLDLGRTSSAEPGRYDFRRAVVFVRECSPRAAGSSLSGDPLPHGLYAYVGSTNGRVMAYALLSEQRLSDDLAAALGGLASIGGAVDEILSVSAELLSHACAPWGPAPQEATYCDACDVDVDPPSEPDGQTPTVTGELRRSNGEWVLDLGRMLLPVERLRDFPNLNAVIPKDTEGMACRAAQPRYLADAIAAMGLTTSRDVDGVLVAVPKQVGRPLHLERAGAGCIVMPVSYEGETDDD